MEHGDGKKGHQIGILQACNAKLRWVLRYWGFLLWTAKGPARICCYLGDRARRNLNASPDVSRVEYSRLTGHLCRQLKDKFWVGSDLGNILQRNCLFWSGPQKWHTVPLPEMTQLNTPSEKFRHIRTP